MSTYFVDVFTSIPPIDYYDRDGNFHSRAESQAAWQLAFDTIRDRLTKANNNFISATTSSEAGMDSLIGHLDGADCQFMYLSPESGEFRIPVKCKEWSRVPWFDAVHHHTFSLHGVGYSNRYEAQRGRALHGIESDDYITSEILTGHALMVDWGSSKRGAVRKYWLAQDLIRHLADKEIVKVEFADGNIHRQIIKWNDETAAYVNLGNDDWDIAALLPANQHAVYTVIPPFGFLVSHDRLGRGIIKTNGRVVEMSENRTGNLPHHIVYINARQKGVENVLPISPSLNSFEYLGENKFKVDFAWKVKGEIPKDLCIFVHCTEKRMNWHQKLKEAFLPGGGYPKTPTSQWKDKIVTEPYTITIPDDLPAGRYYLVVGLYDSKGDGRRAKLMAFDTGADRYAVGWLKFERKSPNDTVSNISLEPFEWEDEKLFERLLPANEPVDFGIAKTKGAFRIEINHKAKTATVTPLPEEPATEIALKLPETAKNVKAVDADGKELRDVPFNVEEKTLIFTTQKEEFLYKITW
jgi:hypothetical protein